MSAGPYSIGSDHLPGLSKLIEECGEVIQVAGKIIGLGHDGDHWDGTNLLDEMTAELADLYAAITFYVAQRGISIGLRSIEKLELFEKWHAEQQREAQP